VGGTLTGLGGDLIIIDDPQKATDAQSQALRDQANQWFSNSLLSRLDNKERGAIIVVMQRVHLNDLTGYVLENSDDWTVLSLPAIAETDERIPIGTTNSIFVKSAKRSIPDMSLSKLSIGFVERWAQSCFRRNISKLPFLVEEP
jgi:hypothetical protein